MISLYANMVCIVYYVDAHSTHLAVGATAYYWYRSNLLRELAQDDKVLIQVLDGILGFLS